MFLKQFVKVLKFSEVVSMLEKRNYFLKNLRSDILSEISTCRCTCVPAMVCLYR